MRANLIFLIALFLAASGLPALGDEAHRSVSVYHGLVTFEIPTHWHEIPPDALEFYSLQSAEQSGGRMVEVYQHGFRPGDPEADFALPQILVQIKENGRLSSRQFRHLPPVETLRKQGEDRLDESMGPLMEDLQLNQVFFDDRTSSIWVSTTLDLTFEGKVLVDTVSYLTERGLFTIHCYASITHNTEMQPVFDRILESVRIDESIRYQPRFSDRLPPRPALIAYSIAAILAIVVLVILALQRRQQST